MYRMRIEYEKSVDLFWYSNCQFNIVVFDIRVNTWFIGLRGFLYRKVLVRWTCWGRDHRYTTWGFLGNPVCETIYPDEGKPCESSDECLSGMCIKSKQPYCRGHKGVPLCSTGESLVEATESGFWCD